MTAQEQIKLLADQLGLSPTVLLKSVCWALGEERINRITPAADQFREWRQSRDGLLKLWTHANRVLASPITQDEAADIWECIDLTLRARKRRPLKFEDYLMIAVRSDQRCEQCGRKPPEAGLEIDHVLPVSRGGRETLLNLRFLCERCNRVRGNKFRWADVWNRNSPEG